MQLDPANGLEANVEIILQRRRMRQASSGSASVASAVGIGASLESLTSSVATTASAVRDFSQHSQAHDGPNKQRASRNEQRPYEPPNTPTLVGLHRRAREPHSASASSTTTAEQSVTVATSNFPRNLGPQPAPQDTRSIQQHQTITNSQAVFDSAFSALNSALKLLVRGMSMYCHLATSVNSTKTIQQTIDQHMHLPCFVLLGRGGTVLHGFWKDEQNQPSEEAFVAPLLSVQRVHLSGQFDSRHVHLVGKKVHVSLVAPDTSARDDWVSALLLVRSCLPGGQTA